MSSGRGSADGSVCVCATVASNTHTHTLLAACIHTQPHLLCGHCGEVLSLVVLPQQHRSSTHRALVRHHMKHGGREEGGRRYSMWRCDGQSFTEHTCWWNKHTGERKLPSPEPRGFYTTFTSTQHFLQEPPNSARVCQTPVGRPKRTSQGGKRLPIHCSPALSLFSSAQWTSFCYPGSVL